MVQIRGQLLKISHDCFFPRSSAYIILAHPSLNAGMLVAETTKVLSNHSTNIRKPIGVTWGTKVEQVATEFNLLVPIVDYVPHPLPPVLSA